MDDKNKISNLERIQAETVIPETPRGVVINGPWVQREPSCITCGNQDSPAILHSGRGVIICLRCIAELYVAAVRASAGQANADDRAPVG